MCISWCSFVNDVVEIAEKSKHLSLDQRWELEGQETKEEGTIFLTKRNQVVLFPSTEKATAEASLEPEEEEEDPATARQTTRSDVFFYDFHIAFCTTFRVPVLLFNVYDKDRRLLRLEEVL